MLKVIYWIPIGGGLPIFGYGLFLMIGFLSGLFLACRRAKRAGLSPNAAMDVGLISVAAGIVGARLAFLLFDYEPGGGGPLEWLAVWQGGLTFQGGLFLAVLADWFYLRRRQIPFGPMADAYAPALAVGVGFGRIGCLLNGCCWGAIAPPGSWLAMFFPDEADPMAIQYWRYETDPSGWAALMRELGFPGDQTPLLPVYATQIISAVGLFLIAGGLLWFEKRRKARRDGRIMAWFLLAYGIGRFLIEFWRDDTPLRYGFGAFPGLRLGQWLALAMIAVGWAWLNRIGKSAPSSPSA